LLTSNHLENLNFKIQTRNFMPIGVPKVPFRLPGDSSAQWVDLYNRLYRERVLFLCQELEDELSNQLIGIMLYLNAEESTKGIYIYINSPGGSVTCGIAVYDAMHYIDSDVTTICVGTAASMASFILAGGDRGKRIALPNARIMIHQPEGGSQGQASEVLSESEEVMRIRRQVGRVYAERTGQPLSRISRDMDRDQFMSAREAKDYGLVDQVAVDTKWVGAA
jgi:ATP-dependent Clp protease protease subunit